MGNHGQATKIIHHFAKCDFRTNRGKGEKYKDGFLHIGCLPNPPGVERVEVATRRRWLVNRGPSPTWRIILVSTPRKTNVTMENLPFEDVFPIENGDFPMSC